MMKKRKKMINRQKGQSVLEYAIILGVVGLALGSMQVYLRRGIQAGIKIAADEIGLQKDAMEVVSGVDQAEYENGDIKLTEVFRQEIKVRSEAWAEREVTHGANGGQSTGIDEGNKIVPVEGTTNSYSKYWSNWQEKPEKWGVGKCGTFPR
jgi:hypothetical protein